MGVELGSVDRVHQPHLIVVVDLDEKSELGKWPGLNMRVGAHLDMIPIISDFIGVVSTTIVTLRTALAIPRLPHASAITFSVIEV